MEAECNNIIIIHYINNLELMISNMVHMWIFLTHYLSNRCDENIQVTIPLVHAEAYL
jgi:hypothetical protein